MPESPNMKRKRNSKPIADPRKQALDRWVSQQFGTTMCGEMAASDAWFRRYFRYPIDDALFTPWPMASCIAMDAPPEHGSCDTFVALAKLLASAHIHVPQILATDLAQGFLLLSDLGQHTLLEVIDDHNADKWLKHAIDTLIHMQRNVNADHLPRYSQTLLQNELHLFTDWYIGRHLKVTLSPFWRQQCDQLFTQLLMPITAQAQCFVHRDYMLRNLMPHPSRLGVLDFQDAVYGPITYDTISLFKDAFLSWPEAQVDTWLKYYWHKARAAQLPVPDNYLQFQLDCDIMSIQRHLKIIGIFARLHYRDGKSRYLHDVPRFFTYLRTVCERRPQLANLAQLLDQVAVWQQV